MGKYVLKRALLLIPTLFIVLTIVFCLLRLVPGSPAREILLEENPEHKPTVEEVEAKETEMGLNDPLVVQWVRYIKDIFSGNWGNSYKYNIPVFQKMVDVWEPTLLIACFATLITVCIAIPAGIFSATHRNSLLDYSISTLSTITMVVPGFCVSMLMQFLFCVWWNQKYGYAFFPATGYFEMSRYGFLVSLIYVAMPSISLGLHHVASMARYTRSTMLDVLSQDYIRTARAKGLSRGKIYYKHALKNTLSIVGTMIAGSIAGMIGGASVTEKVFNIQGMGTLTVGSLGARDYPQEQAIVLFTSFLFLGLDLLLDIMYKLLDPRIEYE